MSRKLIWPIFWALVAVFIFVVCLLFVPAVQDWFSGSLLFLAPMAVYFLLGVGLIVSTLRGGAGGKLKRFLLLTSGAAVGFFVAVLLHNAFYALAELSSNVTILGPLMEFLHAAFFFMAFPVCPLAFLVGVVGTIVLAARGHRVTG